MCVCVWCDRDENMPHVTQQSLSLRSLSNTHWHTFIKHSLHPPTAVPVLTLSFSLLYHSLSFFPYSLSFSITLSVSFFFPSGHLSIPVPFMGKMFGWDLFFCLSGPLLNAHSALRTRTFVKRWNAVWNKECHPDLLHCFSQYLYTKVSVEIKMTPGSSPIPVVIFS